MDRETEKEGRKQMTNPDEGHASPQEVVCDSRQECSASHRESESTGGGVSRSAADMRRKKESGFGLSERGFRGDKKGSRRECVAVHDVDVSHCLSLAIHSLFSRPSPRLLFSSFYCLPSPEIRLLRRRPNCKINLTLGEVNRGGKKSQSIVHRKGGDGEEP